MEDLTCKMESIYGVHKYSSVGQQTGQYILFPAAFLSDLVQMLPKIFEFFNQLANQLKIIIDRATATGADANVSTENVLYSDESNYIKCCFGLCLRLLAAQFTWPGYDDVANKNLLSGEYKRPCAPLQSNQIVRVVPLADSLNAIIGDVPLDPAETENSHIALVALKAITANANVVLDLQTATYMIDLTRTLIKYVNVENAYNDFVGE